MKVKNKIVRFVCKSCEACFEIRGNITDMTNVTSAYDEDPGMFHCNICRGVLRRSPFRVGTDFNEVTQTTPDVLWLWANVAVEAAPEFMAEIKAVLVGSTIYSAEIRAEAGRCIIHSLTMTDGVRFHFSASGLGAMIERMEKEDGRTDQRTRGESTSTSRDVCADQGAAEGECGGGEDIHRGGEEPQES